LTESDEVTKERRVVPTLKTGPAILELELVRKKREVDGQIKVLSNIT
jgi:hypothetical protein